MAAARPQNLQDDKSAFSQFTVRIHSRQIYAAYDARGRVVAGDPDATLPVTDLWVFERSLSDNLSNRWPDLPHWPLTSSGLQHLRPLGRLRSTPSLGMVW